jgi:hypothetical protein
MYRELPFCARSKAKGKVSLLRLFAFRNRIQFVERFHRFGEKLLTIEGEEWIREAARAAAEADTLPGPWTSAVSPRALPLSE